MGGEIKIIKRKLIEKKRTAIFIYSYSYKVSFDIV